MTADNITVDNITYTAMGTVCTGYEEEDDALWYEEGVHDLEGATTAEEAFKMTEQLEARSEAIENDLLMCETIPQDFDFRKIFHPVRPYCIIKTTTYSNGDWKEERIDL